MSKRTRIKIKRAYFLWLCEVCGALDKERVDSGGYILLMGALFKREFYWTIEMDENRAEDGKELRSEFNADISEELNGPCNLLELLIGLARRWYQETRSDGENDRSKEYFWCMISNLGLLEYTDECFDEEKVRKILDIFVDREYCKDGVGGLFPVKDAKKDFREVELWYQLQEYLIENS